MRTCLNCGADLPPNATSRRKFCTDACRVANGRKQTAVQIPEFADDPDSVADAYLAPREPVEQLAVAILHARSIARVFWRLSRTVPPAVSWRAANVGADLTETLDTNFPDTE